MWKISRIAVLIVCLGSTGAVRAYELVQVLTGSTLLVKQDDGRQVRLELSGVWVPAPPGAGVQAEYMGAEARAFVKEALLTMPAYIKEVEPVAQRSEPIAVRIRVGEHADYDLAELLARAGLGLVSRTAIADPNHLDAIYRGEREARRAHRGMHDGGYEAFNRRAGRVVLNFGIGTLAAPESRRRGALRAYVERLEGSSKSGRAPGGIHSNPVAAIRDWGSKMGLPPDASAMGR